jgi:2-keto-4-pentenoate hydratase/2-oxohepta-3-ene-1,7-dioic acid hydratase in catechol pathway
MGMNIIRFLDADGTEHHGVWTGPGRARRLRGNILFTRDLLEEEIPVARVLAPLVPVAVLCVGLNYRKHAEETGARIPEYPVLFMKSPATVQHPGAPIELPRHLRSDQVDYEGELAVVIGKPCKNISRERAMECVLGFTCANDVSARDWQKGRGGSQWCRGKGFDTFCPLGPWITLKEAVPDPQALILRTRVNGEVVQEASTADMIFDIPALIEFLSGSTTLLPGTVILTGTPSGVGMARKPPRWLQPGDTVSVEISGIGTLENPVVEEAA